MTLFYHRTHKSNVPAILKEGIRCGSEVEQGERLPFVMATISEYHVGVGYMAVIAFELDENDPKLCQVNRDWIEYYANVPVENLRLIAYPPSTNNDVINLLSRYDWDPEHPHYRMFFEYQEIHLPQTAVLIDQLNLMMEGEE